MKQRELSTYEKIMLGYAELTKEVTREEDQEAIMKKGQEKVAEGVAMKQTGKTFYEMFNESNPFNKAIPPYLLVKAGYETNNIPGNAKTKK